MTTLEAGRSDFHCLCLQLHKNKTKPPKDIKIREKKRKKMVKVWMLTCVDKHAHTHKQSRHRMCEPSCELELVSKAILNTINTMAHIVTLTHTHRGCNDTHSHGVMLCCSWDWHWVYHTVRQKSHEMTGVPVYACICVCEHTQKDKSCTEFKVRNMSDRALHERRVTRQRGEGGGGGSR